MLKLCFDLYCKLRSQFLPHKFTPISIAFKSLFRQITLEAKRTIFSFMLNMTIDSTSFHMAHWSSSYLYMSMVGSSFELSLQNWSYPMCGLKVLQSRLWMTASRNNLSQSILLLLNWLDCSQRCRWKLPLAPHWIHPLAVFERMSKVFAQVLMIHQRL